jgi:hypothetical protein
LPWRRKEKTGVSGNDQSDLFKKFFHYYYSNDLGWEEEAA